MSVVRAAILVLTLIEAGWMAFDGSRAMVTGSLITPRTGPHAGRVGPWRLLVAPLGVNPNGPVMHAIFAVYGVVWLAIAIAFAAGRPWAWQAMVAAAAGSLWYLPMGTVLSLVQLGLLLVWRQQLR